MQWIPVEVRLPDDERMVLITHQCEMCEKLHAPYQCFIGYCIMEEPREWSFPERYLGTVTHWMELPPPPKGY